MVDTIGAPLRIILAKKAPRPNAVADFSTSKMRALQATYSTLMPLTPNRQIKKIIGKATVSVYCNPYVSMRTPPTAETRKQTMRLILVPIFSSRKPAKKIDTISDEMLITPVRYTCSNMLVR